MLIDSLKTIFIRDLNRLIKEMELYQNEENIWVVDHSILNSGGNLCLHIIGNLNTFIGQVLGNSGYVRNRDAEFSLKNILRAEMIEQITELIEIVDQSLNKVTGDMLETEYPMVVFSSPTSTEFMLVHLSSHLTYHLGQINYHRRLLDH